MIEVKKAWYIIINPKQKLNQKQDLDIKNIMEKMMNNFIYYNI